ncbi:MAG: helicase-associated domain-containing protein [Treponema sp.]|jgi:hypothetical protein|nr:helicase-associated domain-containing protein [Treponema sp.]
MKTDPFRSVEDWKSALMILPDNAFFELLRNVLGNIKTPFNKQRLVEDLVSFLSREEIRNTLAAYIDERDAKIIAAVALLDEPVAGDLERFFTGEFSYIEIHDLLLNLEERCILYRFQQDGIRHLALNPLLETVLAPYTMDTGFWVTNQLFPSVPILPMPAVPVIPSWDDRIIAAIFTFVLEEREFFKAEGGIRKKVLDRGKRLFPGFSLETLVGVLQCLGLLRPDTARSHQGEGLNPGLEPDMQRLNAFKVLSRRERLEYCAAGIYGYRNRGNPSVGIGIPVEASSGITLPGSSSLVSPRQIRVITGFIHNLLDTLEPGRYYPGITIRRLMDILEREAAKRTIEPAWGIQGATGHDFASLLEALEMTGLLERSSPDWWTPGAVLSGTSGGLGEAGETGPASPERPVLVMDTVFSCILYPEIAFADALTLALFSSVQEVAVQAPIVQDTTVQGTGGMVVRFELSRASVVRGFDRGIKAETMVDHLNRLSGNRLDQSLSWTMKDWESRYAGVSLYQGVVLTLAEDRRYLVETKPVASLVRRILGPGVYLLSVPEKAEAMEALQKAGVDIIAQPPLKDILNQDEPWRTPYPAPRSLNLEAKPPLFSPAYRPPPAKPPLEAVKERFRQALGKMQLSQIERDELAARIERRLILSEPQLTGATIRYEKLEARGLDYVGKMSIAKQAIASKSYVEIRWPNPEGGTNQALGILDALEKWGGESVLIIKPISQGDDIPLAPIRLPLGKISFLRRIKPSIFGE